MFNVESSKCRCSKELIQKSILCGQQLYPGGAKNRASLPTSSRKLETIPARNRDETELSRGPNCRPPRPALGEVQHNLLQPCSSNDADTKKLRKCDPSEKENQQCARFLLTASL